MKDYFYLNSSKMIEVCMKLDGAEIKMLYAMMYCLSNTGDQWFINNEDNRKLMAEMDFARTPERICSLLSSMTKKGVLKKEIKGVYSLPENLMIVP